MSAVRKRIPSPEIREPLLRLVDRAAVRSESRRRLIVTLSVGAVVVALFAVALTQARLVQTQRDVDALYAQIEEVEATRAQLANDVVHAESPDGIIARAIELGMVKAQQPIHLEAVRGPSVKSDSEDDVAEEVLEDETPQSETPDDGVSSGGSPADGLDPADPVVGGSLNDVLDPLPSEGENK